MQPKLCVVWIFLVGRETQIEEKREVYKLNFGFSRKIVDILYVNNIFDNHFAFERVRVS